MKFKQDELAKALRIKCAELDITYTEASKRIGISKATYSRLATMSGIPDIITYAKVCNWLGVAMGYFFEGVALF